MNGMNQPSKMTWKRFGALIRRLRQEKGIGLRELSKRARARMGGRGLSSPYLSRIESGNTAPPRPPVLRVLADILEVPVRKLQLSAEGWVVLDIAEMLEPFPEYKDVLRQAKEERATLDDVFGPLSDAFKRHPTKGERKWEMFFSPDGETTHLFCFRASKN